MGGCVRAYLHSCLSDTFMKFLFHIFVTLTGGPFLTNAAGYPRLDKISMKLDERDAHGKI